IIKVVEKKIENPYQVYESHLRIPKNISENINFLNKNIKDYNDRIDNVASIKNNLLSQNKQIANYEYQSIYKSYKDAEKNLSELEDDLKNACSNKTKLDNEIHKLQLKKSNTKIALDQINNYLRFIFFDSERMYLQPSETGNYEVWIKNNRVNLSDLSSGERNIISLCYFFSKLNENKETNNASPKFIVIDDPISSFDSQNKMGMLSFLRHQLFNYFTENQSNKLMILTHDVYTAIQFTKILDDVKEQEKKVYNTYISYELKNKSLSKLNL